jgi:hypothetical protein
MYDASISTTDLHRGIQEAKGRKSDNIADYTVFATMYPVVCSPFSVSRWDTMHPLEGLRWTQGAKGESSGFGSSWTYDWVY